MTTYERIQIRRYHTASCSQSRWKSKTNQDVAFLPVRHHYMTGYLTRNLSSSTCNLSNNDVCDDITHIWRETTIVLTPHHCLSVLRAALHTWASCSRKSYCVLFPTSGVNWLMHWKLLFNRLQDDFWKQIFGILAYRFFATSGSDLH